MSWYLADEKNIIGQFASACGLIPLRTACQSYPALKNFFDIGATKNIAACISGLDSIADHSDENVDVKSTAAGLANLMKGQAAVFITDGSSDHEEDEIDEQKVSSMAHGAAYDRKHPEAAE
jgi:hypothetical protein